MSPVPLPDVQTLREGRKFADPRTFPAIFSLLLLLGLGGLIYQHERTDVSDRAAFLAALDKNSQAIEKLAEKIAITGLTVEQLRREVERIQDRSRR